jgi:thiamine monophosphate kinase
VTEVARQLGRDAAEFAATAGEDYELCACVPGAALGLVKAQWPRWGSGQLPPLSVIGRVLAQASGLTFTDAGSALSGYEH